jgi:hypothetical protein
MNAFHEEGRRREENCMNRNYFRCELLSSGARSLKLSMGLRLTRLIKLFG